MAVPNPSHTLWLYTARAVPDPTKLDMPLSPTALRASGPIPNVRIWSQIRCICRVGGLPYPCCYETGSPADVIFIQSSIFTERFSILLVRVLSHNFPANHPTPADEIPACPCHFPLGTRTLLPFLSLLSHVAPCFSAFPSCF